VSPRPTTAIASPATDLDITRNHDARRPKRRLPIPLPGIPTANGNGNWEAQDSGFQRHTPSNALHTSPSNCVITLTISRNRTCAENRRAARHHRAPRLSPSQKRCNSYSGLQARCADEQTNRAAHHLCPGARPSDRTQIVRHQMCLVQRARILRILSTFAPIPSARPTRRIAFQTAAGIGIQIGRSRPSATNHA
jgi:hypothetical protein